MENTDNQNSTNHIAQAKLFKSSFQGASGNEIPVLSDTLIDPENDTFVERLRQEKQRK